MLCNVSGYRLFNKIRSFRHERIEKIFIEDDRSKINQDHVPQLVRILDRLDASSNPQDMNSPGYHLHELPGKYKNIWSVMDAGAERRSESTLSNLFVCSSRSRVVPADAYSGLE